MKSLNILVSSTRQWNPGDEFILMGVQNLLSEYLPTPINWVLYDRNPDLLVSAYDNPIHRDVFWTNAFHHNHLVGFDLAVVAGTPEWFGGPMKKFYSLIRQYGVPLVILGAGYFDAPIAFSDDEIYCLHKLAKVVTVRDRYASKALSRIKIPHALLPDPALFASTEVKSPRKIRKIGFILQSDKTTNQKIPRELVEAGMRAALKAKEKGFEVELVYFYIDEAVEFLGKEGFPVRYSYNSHDYIDILKGYDAIVSTRLHGAIFANSLGKPAVLFNRDSRCEGAAVLFPFILLSDSESIIDRLREIDIKRVNKELSKWKDLTRQEYKKLLKSIHLPGYKALKATYPSTNWKLMQRPARLKRRVFPIGSWRRRLWLLLRRVFQLHAQPAQVPPDHQVWFHCDNPVLGGPHVLKASDLMVINGWAISHQNISEVLVYCDDELQGKAAYGNPRVDVAHAYPQVKESSKSGFQYLWDTNSVENGIHKLKIEARNQAGVRNFIEGKIYVDNLSNLYDRWQQQHTVDESALQWMRCHSRELYKRPRFSILIAASGTQIKMLHRTLNSLIKQVYPEWEACVVIQRESYEKYKDLMHAIVQDNNPKIKVFDKDFSSLEEAWNLSLREASGDFIAIAGEGDCLQPHALFEAAYKLNLTNSDLIYSDEDMLSPEGKRHTSFFKPGWSPDLFLSMNYIGRLWVARTELVKKVGAFRPDFQGAGEYDLLLRLTEAAQRVDHVSTVLYNRAEELLDNGVPDSSKRISRMGVKALEETLYRRGIKGEVIPLLTPGMYRVRRAIQGQPIVTIIIPTNGKSNSLRRCLESIFQKTTYTNYELIIINNSRGEQAENIDYLRFQSCRIIEYSAPFNWSKINNFGAASAAGEYFVFLNDNTEVVSPEWLEALLEHAQRPEVAFAGAKLLYPEGRIQHAGMFLLDSGGYGGHAFHNLPADDSGYFGFLNITRNCIGVTSACCMIRREMFYSLGQFDEQLGATGNDIDCQLRALVKGNLIVWTPYAVLYHREAASRHNLPEQRDPNLLYQRWRSVIERGDFYYNPNLTTREFGGYTINKEPTLLSYASPTAMDLSQIHRILVVKLDHIGDVVLSLPAMKRLRQLFPDAEISALVGSWAKPLLEHEQFIDRIIIYDFFRKESVISPDILTEAEKREIAQWLGEFRFDLAIDLRKDVDTREFLRLSGARYTVGYSHTDEHPWLTFCLPFDPPISQRQPRRHVILEIVNLVEALRIAGGLIPNVPQIYLSSEEQKWACTFRQSLLPDADNVLVVGIHPGVGQPIRRWPLEYFARLADIFVKRLGARVLIFAGNNEANIAQELLDKMEHKDHAISLAGRLNLRQFCAFVRECDVFVGNNSGPTHIAAASGVPTLGIYSGTNAPREWGVVGSNVAVIHKDMNCSPCYLANESDCLYNMACMRQLNVEKVWEAVLRVLVPKWPKFIKGIYEYSTYNP